MAIILFTGVIFFFITYQKPEFSEESVQTLDFVTNSISGAIQTCLEQKTLEAISFFGLNTTKIEDYTTEEVSICAQKTFDSLDKRYQLSHNLEFVNANLNQNNLLIALSYPIQISLGEEKLSIQNFNYQILLETDSPIISDSSCKTLNETAIYSFDGKFSIKIPEGTIAKYKNGSCLDTLILTIQDPKIVYGERFSSLSNLQYLAGPEGAEFESPVELKLTYSDEEYDRYILSSALSKKYFEYEDDLYISYFDNSSNESYIYPNDIALIRKVDTSENTIFSQTTIFYDGEISTHAKCSIKQGVIIGSENRKVNLILSTGTTAKKSEGSCLDKIDIVIEPRRSNVVTFGDYEYLFYPRGAKFEDSITYIYKYSMTEISDPRFLYGHYSWQDLITQNWTAPELNYSESGIRVDEVIERIPEDLNIAHFDEEEGMYVPLNTYVDTKRKRIVADIDHFSQIVAAQGCNDQRYYKMSNILEVPLVSGANCTGEEAEQLEIAFKPIVGNSCGDKGGKGLMSAGISHSVGDQGDAKQKEESVLLVDLKDSDKKITDDGNCANMDLYINIKGIGIESSLEGDWVEATKEEVSKNFDYFGRVWLTLNVSKNYSMGSGMCEESADKCNENLCERCGKDVTKKYGLTASADGAAYWNRVNICVRGESCKDDEDHGESSSGDSAWSGVVSAITNGQTISSNGYSIKQIAKFSDYVWFMASVGNRLYSGVYGSPQVFYYSDYPFTTWAKTQVSSNDESKRVYNLNNRSYATSEGGNNGGGGARFMQILQFVMIFLRAHLMFWVQSIMIINI